MFFNLILSLIPGLLFSKNNGPAMSTLAETQGRWESSNCCSMVFHCRAAKQV